MALGVKVLGIKQGLEALLWNCLVRLGYSPSGNYLLSTRLQKLSQVGSHSIAACGALTQRMLELTQTLLGSFLQRHLFQHLSRLLLTHARSASRQLCHGALPTS